MKATRQKRLKGLRKKEHWPEFKPELERTWLWASWILVPVLVRESVRVSVGGRWGEHKRAREKMRRKENKRQLNGFANTVEKTQLEQNIHTQKIHIRIHIKLLWNSICVRVLERHTSHGAHQTTHQSNKWQKQQQQKNKTLLPFWLLKENARARGGCARVCCSAVALA